MVKIVRKIINLSLPNLACFAPWRESIPAFEYFRLLENLREPRKLLNIVVQNNPSRSVNSICATTSGLTHVQSFI